jgi:cytochrome c
MARYSWLALGILLACVAHGQDSPGAELFRKRCGGCHAMDRDKTGPNLKGVYGRHAASGGTFPYSDALRNLDVTWNAATLDRWLADPEKLAPGNEMTFHVEKAAERALIIAYLKETSGR